MSSQVTEEEEAKQGNITSLGNNNAEVHSDITEDSKNVTKGICETNESKQTESIKLEEVDQDIEMVTAQKVAENKTEGDLITSEANNTEVQGDTPMKDSEEVKVQIKQKEEQTQEVIQEESEAALHPETQTGSDNAEEDMDEVNLL